MLDEMEKTVNEAKENKPEGFDGEGYDEAAEKIQVAKAALKEFKTEEIEITDNDKRVGALKNSFEEVGKTLDNAALEVNTFNNTMVNQIDDSTASG